MISIFHLRLSLSVLIVLGVWLLLAILIVLVVRPFIASSGIAIEFVGTAFLVALLVFGLAVVTLRPLPAPVAKHKTSIVVYALRSLAAMLAVFFAVLIGSVDPVIGGIASMAPAIFMTSMISLAISQGFEFSSGSTGPLMLGSVSVGVFALVFANLFPLIVEKLIVDDIAAALAFTCSVTYVICVLFVSLPIYQYLAFLRRRSERKRTVSQRIEQQHQRELQDDNNESDNVPLVVTTPDDTEMTDVALNSPR